MGFLGNSPTVWAGVLVVLGRFLTKVLRFISSFLSFLSHFFSFISFHTFGLTNT